MPRRALQPELRPFPNPGCLPRKAPPKAGEKITFLVSGFPPFKEIRASIRNPQHRCYDRFVELRKAATQAMRGRGWTDEAVALKFTMSAPAFEKGKALLDYLSGIMDTLDGSHGPHFTYLPIVFQDDCQVAICESHFRHSKKIGYVVEVEFLGEKEQDSKFPMNCKEAAHNARTPSKDQSQ